MPRGRPPPEWLALISLSQATTKLHTLSIPLFLKVAITCKSATPKAANNNQPRRRPRRNA